MLSRCANADCAVPAHSFTEGRLFQFEVVSISVAANDETNQPFDEKPERETVHLWLCGHCSASMTLVLDPAKGLQLVSLGSHEMRLKQAHEQETSTTKPLLSSRTAGLKPCHL